MRTSALITCCRPWLAALALTIGLGLPGLTYGSDAPATQPATQPAQLAGVGPVNIDHNSDKVNSGDTAWMLTSSALVLMMTGPGLALFYSGLVRRKNVLATMMQSFVLMCIVTVLWAIVGYSL